MNNCCKDKIDTIIKISKQVDILKAKTLKLQAMLEAKGMLNDNAIITIRKDVK